MDKEILITELMNDAMIDLQSKADQLIKEFKNNLLKTLEIEKEKVITGFIMNQFGDICCINDYRPIVKREINKRNSVFDSEWQVKEYDKKELIFRKVIRARDKVRDCWIPDGDNVFDVYFISPENPQLDYLATNQKSFIFPMLCFKNREQIDFFRRLITNVELLEFFNI